MNKMFQHTKAVLIDLSGTIHIDNASIPGAKSAIQKLRNKNLKIKFVTNTSKESLISLHSRLTKLDFDINISEIYTSLTSTCDIIKSMSVRPLLLLSDSAKEDFKAINVQNPNAVIVGLSPDHFNYHSLDSAFQLLLNGAPLIAINKARYFKTPNGLSLGTGPFVAALEYASDVKAIVVGKPEKDFFLGAVREFNCDPDECVMIGDDIRDDVGGAINAGMKGILVKTGKYRLGDEKKINLDDDFVFSDISQAVDKIISDLV